MRLPVFVAAVALAALACADAKPGTTGGGGSSQAAAGGGGAGVGGVAGGGNAGPAPDFSAATVHELTNPGANSDAFGSSVAIDGTTVLVGAPRESTGALASGAIHVFVRPGDSWMLQSTLKAQAPEKDDFFGDAVAIEGDTALGGAWDRGPGQAGAAFALERSGTSWVEQYELVQTPPVTSANMGKSVSVSGNRVLVGAPHYTGTGRALVFERSGGSWIPAGEMVAPMNGEQFGFAVALDGDTALIGAPGTFDATGHAFIYQRQGPDWVQTAELKPGAGLSDEHYGRAVALDGDTAVVGAVALLEEGKGSAYVFVRSGDGWKQQAQLLAEDGMQGDSFGSAVAVSGNAALVGARWVDGAEQNIGAAYVFARVGTTWSQQTKLLPPADAVVEARFGTSVAIAGKLAVVGARAEANFRGRAVVYEAP